ncbi:MAG: metallophosphoesterase family protein [Verrucomicrobia bacterium]|nr:metallophosphoesterase family protein [Verrucomicrobiota bacterium]
MNITPTDPVLIISDLHLGHRASRIRHPEELEWLFKPFRTVIFNGDTAEMRNPEDRPIGRKLAADVGRVCHHAGSKAIFISGNHDPTISSLDHLDLHGGALLVTHGDILFLGVAPWSRAAKPYRETHRQFLAQLGEDAYTDFEQRLLATKRTSITLQMYEPPLTRKHQNWGGLHTLIHQLWPPWRPLKILQAWWQTPALTADMTHLFRPKAGFTVIGHTHFPGIWRRGKRVVINTGSFLKYMAARGVIIEGNRLEVRFLKRCGNRFCLGRVDAVFRLPDENPAQPEGSQPVPE